MHAARFIRFAVAAAALFAPTLLGSTALAGSSASKPASPDAAPHLIFDPKQFVVPQASGDTNRFTPKISGEDKPAFAMPKIDLGTSQLHLDTDRKAIDTGPRVGIEPADPAALNPNLGQRKEPPLDPYVGFTLSTPME